MAVKEIKDIGTSVLTKLKKQAKETGINYQTCLQLFAQEEFLRHAASEIMSHQKLSGEVEIDTQYKSINLKGTCPQICLDTQRKEVNRLHIEEYLITRLPLSVLQMKMII